MCVDRRAHSRRSLTTGTKGSVEAMQGRLSKAGALAGCLQQRQETTAAAQGEAYRL
jgi:hypothetical protein